MVSLGSFEVTSGSKEPPQPAGLELKEVVGNSWGAGLDIDKSQTGANWEMLRRTRLFCRAARRKCLNAFLVVVELGPSKISGLPSLNSQDERDSQTASLTRHANQIVSWSVTVCMQSLGCAAP